MIIARHRETQGLVHGNYSPSTFCYIFCFNTCALFEMAWVYRMNSWGITQVPFCRYKESGSRHSALPSCSWYSGGHIPCWIRQSIGALHFYVSITDQAGCLRFKAVRRLRREMALPVCQSQMAGVWLPVFVYADRAHAWSTSSVWYREGFMQVEVAYIGADPSRACQSHLGIHVGAVHMARVPVIVDQVNVLYAFFKYAMRAGVSDHQPGQVVFEFFQHWPVNLLRLCCPCRRTWLQQL